MDNYREKLKIINILVNFGYSILEIEKRDEVFFYVCDTFEKSESGALNSADFISFKGSNIDEFLDSQSISFGEVGIRDGLANFKEKNNSIENEISSNHMWRFYRKD